MCSSMPNPAQYLDNKFIDDDYFKLFVDLQISSATGRGLWIYSIRLLSLNS